MQFSPKTMSKMKTVIFFCHKLMVSSLALGHAFEYIINMMISWTYLHSNLSILASQKKNNAQQRSGRFLFYSQKENETHELHADGCAQIAEYFSTKFPYLEAIWFSYDAIERCKHGSAAEECCFGCAIIFRFIRVSAWEWHHHLQVLINLDRYIYLYLVNGLYYGSHSSQIILEHSNKISINQIAKKVWWYIKNN